MKPGHVMIGALMVGAGALAALWLPLGLMGSLALLALLRICWIEDNITSDLFGCETLPSGYVQTLERRQRFMRQWFGVDRAAVLPDQSAHLMATTLRAEAQLWGAYLLGFTSMICGQHGPFDSVVNALLAVGMMVLAFSRVDRLAVTLHHCDIGQPLPDAMLLPPLRRSHHRLR